MRKIDIKGHIVSDDHIEVYQWFGISATSPRLVKEAIAEAEANSENELLLEINSGGGSVWAGAEMYYALMKFNGTVNGEIPSIAASAATFPAMACDKLSMSLLGQFMIHGAKNGIQGTQQDMYNNGDFLKNIDDSIINAYLTKTSMSQDELQVMMKKDTWMTAQQALENGFIDEILFENKTIDAVASTDISNAGTLLSQEVIDKVKAEIFAGKTNSLPDPVNFAEPSDPQQTKEDNTMDLTKLQNEHPELFKQVKNLGYTEGVVAENSRIQGIDELALLGNESMVQAAKYTAPITAEQLAVQMIKAQKESGQNYLNNAQKDAAPLANVTPSAAPEADNVSDDAKAAGALLNLWGGQKQ